MGYSDGFRDDETIGLEVRDALAAEQALDARQIELEVRDGVVILEGWVTSEDQKALALMTARNVLGVKDVQVRLMVQQQPSGRVQFIPKERHTASSSWMGWIRRLFGSAGEVH